MALCFIGWCERAQHDPEVDHLVAADSSLRFAKDVVNTWLTALLIQSRQAVRHVEQLHRRGGDGFTNCRIGFVRADGDAVGKCYGRLIAIAFGRC